MQDREPGASLALWWGMGLGLSAPLWAKTDGQETPDRARLSIPGGRMGWILPKRQRIQGEEEKEWGLEDIKTCSGFVQAPTFCLAHVVSLHEVLGAAADMGAFGVVAELGAGPEVQALVDIWAEGR